MHPDLAWLIRGLGGLALVGLSACDSPEPHSTSEDPFAGLPPLHSHTGPWVAGSAGETPHPPAGRWCFTPELTEPMRYLGSPVEDGCAKFIDGEKIPPGKDASPEYRGMPRSTRGFYDPIVTQMRRSALGQAPYCCYTWREKVPGGRPLIVEGEAALAPLLESEEHAARGSELALPPARIRGRLSQYWLENARMEHASVASFARARLELLQLGAPAHLVQATIRAARDELRHAAICMEVAQAWGAAPMRFGALQLEGATRADLSIQRLAQQTLEEAFEPEAAAALALYQASQRAICPVLKAYLLEIATDERRHTALAWETLKWCRSQRPLRLDISRLEALNANPNLNAQLASEASSEADSSCWGEIPNFANLRKICRASLIEPSIAQLS